MITLNSYEGKNIEIAKDKCLMELNLRESDVYFKEEQTDSSLFKTKKAVVLAISKKEIISYIKEFVKNLSTNMGLKINCEIRFDSTNVNVLLISDNNNILIGKDGKTLNAIQLILRQAMKELNQFGLKLIVDVGNYKFRKSKRLESEIKNICEEVINSKVEVKLDPMNSYERRIVHNIVSEYEDLTSISEGVEPNRFTIIKYRD